MYRFSRDLSINFHLDEVHQPQGPFQTPPPRSLEAKNKIPSAQQMQGFGSGGSNSRRDFSLNYDDESPVRKVDRVGRGLKKE
jgi:hypothetical protein